MNQRLVLISLLALAACPSPEVPPAPPALQASAPVEAAPIQEQVEAAPAEVAPAVAFTESEEPDPIGKAARASSPVVPAQKPVLLPVKTPLSEVLSAPKTTPAAPKFSLKGLQPGLPGLAAPPDPKGAGDCGCDNKAEKTEKTEKTTDPK